VRPPRRRSAETTRAGCRTNGSTLSVRSGTDRRKPHIEDAPYLVVVFEQAYGVRADGRRFKHYYVKESVGIAVGFRLASLHEAGRATLTHRRARWAFSARYSIAPRTNVRTC
jgi:iodotyrosine deiodinase